MKSIKEKAEEVFPIEEYDSLETELQRRKMRLCYEYGANYVLDAITECMPKTSAYNPNEVIDIITSMIKQLKK